LDGEEARSITDEAALEDKSREGEEKHWIRTKRDRVSENEKTRCDFAGARDKYNEEQCAIAELECESWELGSGNFFIYDFFFLENSTFREHL
jgi:hypothetical protein